MRTMNARFEYWVGEHPVRAALFLAAFMIMATALLGGLIDGQWLPDWPQLVILDALFPAYLVWQARRTYRLR